MNIQAINATSNLNRPRVPRSVSFGNNMAQAAGDAVENTVKKTPKFIATIGQFLTNAKNNIVKFAKNAGEKIEPFKNTVAKYAKKGTDKAGETLNGAGKSIKGFSEKALGALRQFVENNKGAKGVKKAAVAVTALITGIFAIKEAHDIITGSNAPKA